VIAFSTPRTVVLHDLGAEPFYFGDVVRRGTVRVVPICLAPCCGGDVVAQTLTDGRCVVCGLQYRRPVGAASWDEIVGLVDITVSIGPSTESRVVRSNGVIYRSEDIYLDIATRTDAAFKRNDIVSIVPVQPVGVYQDALPGVSDPRLITDLRHGATTS
jgi:hypothetical protein